MTRNRYSIDRKNLAFARVKAIKAHSSGMSNQGIAKMFGVHEVTVSRWLRRYRQGGAKALLEKKSSGRPRKIDCETFAPKLTKLIKSPATKFGFESPLWNCARVRQVVKRELGYNLSKSTIWRSMREIGLSPQKPECRAVEQDPVARKKWLEKTWPELREKAKSQRAVILFEDECSVSLSPTVGRTWSKISHTPQFKKFSGWGCIGVISAISTSGRLYFKLPKGNVDSDEFIKFIKQILKEIPRKKVYMVVDNCKSHKSKKTTAFVDSNDRFELVYLPSYSPDFNPDELTRARLKRVELIDQSVKKKSELRRKTLGKMRSIQKKKSLIKSFVAKIY